MKLSILIVNWNSKDYLRACLESIRRTCVHLSPQVVVVDGGSFDGCAEMLAADFPEVEFVQSQDNIGFGRSNNLGFERVTGEALLLLNPDTELQPGAVDALLTGLQQVPDAGLIGARLLNSDGSLQFASVHPLPTPWNAAWDCDWLRRRWWSRKGRWNATTPFVVQAVSGACMMMRAATFRELGGFDPRFFMYAEDMDLCFRIHKSGMRVCHAPQAVLIHHGGGSSSTHFSKFAEVMIREALDFYFRSNHGRIQSCLYRVLIFLSAVSRITILWLRGLVAHGQARDSARASIIKWWTLLRWSIGLESWAADWFRSGGKTAVTQKSQASSPPGDCRIP
jgi:GT2 family glycosyltransferase